MNESHRFKAGEELRRRVLESASELFAEQGYAQVSVRQIAERAGCSPMAMYRHFPDKQALFHHLCDEVYRSFTTDLHEQFGSLADPRERLWLALRQFLVLSMKNPHHYRLLFLEMERDAQSLHRHDGLSGRAMDYIRDNLRACLPKSCPASGVERLAHQLLAMVHGLTVLHISHTRSYGLTEREALRSLESAMDTLLCAAQARGCEDARELAGQTA